MVVEAVVCVFERVGGARAWRANIEVKAFGVYTRGCCKERVTSTNKRQPYERIAERDARVVMGVEFCTCASRRLAAGLM
jgi:hypothetical protein